MTAIQTLLSHPSQGSPFRGLLIAVGNVSGRMAVDDGLDRLAFYAARVAVIIAIYLAVITVAHLVARYSRIAFAHQVLRRLTPGFLMTILVGLAATAATAGAQTDSHGPASPDGLTDTVHDKGDTPVMRVVDTGAVTDTSVIIPWISHLAIPSTPDPISPTEVVPIRDGQSAEVAVDDDGSVPTSTTMGSSAEGRTVEATYGHEPAELPSGPTMYASTVGNSASTFWTMLTQDGPSASADAEDPRSPVDDVSPEPASVPDVHVVESGEHLWSIAESTLTNAEVSQIDAALVGRYWSSLIELNRDRLVDPQNPDLIMPGQQFLLPPLP